MDPTPLTQIAGWTGGSLGGPRITTTITRIVTDGREAGPGAMFAALAGTRTDGHAFVAQAAARGASAALVARPVDAPVPQVVVPDVEQALFDLALEVRAASRARVVVITGSVGKTQTKGLVAAALQSAGETVASPASFNNHQGVPLTLLLLKASTAFAVVEVGANHPGEVARLAGLAGPEVAVVTAVGPAHLEGFGSMRGVLAAKAEVLSAILPGGTLVVSLSDPRVARLAGRWSGRMVAVGPGSRPGPGGAVSARAAALALGTCKALGVPLAPAERAMASAAPPPHRLDFTRRAGMTLIDDTYNANPLSTAAALDELTAGQGRAIAVLGDHLELGHRSPRWHRWIGRRTAMAGVDVLVAVGTFAAHTAAGAIDAGMGPERVWTTEGRGDAAEVVLGLVRPGDRILVKASHAAGLDLLVAAIGEPPLRAAG